MDRIALVERRRGRAGKVVDLVQRPLPVDPVQDVLLEKAELGMIEQPSDILFAAGQKIIETDDGMALGNQPLAKMRANKTGSSRDENDLPAMETRHKRIMTGHIDRNKASVHLRNSDRARPAK